MVFPASWLVLSTVGIILVVFALGYFWARTHGQLDDVEEAKYAMLESEGIRTVEEEYDGD
ncbi:MAG TPA: hypothetical protein VJB88_08910 [Vicinamibacteria bacterium]|nr:hypothetical protein [Vicinamibacteria bacterium]